MRRWQRILICLLLVCCILVNLSPLRADATAAGVAGTIAGVTAVNVPAGLVYGAAAITLGVMAGTNDDFQNLVDSGVSAGSEWIKDGCVELLRVVDEAGNAIYYVAGEFLEFLRQGLFDSDVLSDNSASLTNSVSYSIGGTDWSVLTSAIGTGPDSAYFVVATGSYYNSGNYADVYSAYILSPANVRFRYSQNGGSYTSYQNLTAAVYTNGYALELGSSSDQVSSGLPVVNVGEKYDSYNAFVNALLSKVVGTSGVNISTEYDLSLGQISTVPIDGTSARSWASDEVADRNGLYVKYNNDPDPPDDNNGHWFWKLMLPVTAASLLAMSQADEWRGETPPEFSDYTTSEEFEILDAPEINGYQGVEIAVPGTGGGTAGDGDSDDDSQESTDPTTSPGGSPGTGGDTGTDTGEDTDPDTGSESDPDADPDTDPDADSDTSTDTSTELNKDLNHFTLDLTKYFPFCIPFDLYDFFTCLNAAPEAPVINWEIPLPGGSTYPMEIDLSPFDSVAQLLRRLQLLLFCTGLAFKTRDLIKG